MERLAIRLVRWRSHRSNKANEERRREAAARQKHARREGGKPRETGGKYTRWRMTGARRSYARSRGKRQKTKSGKEGWRGGGRRRGTAVGGCRGWNEILICGGARNPCSRPALVHHFPPISLSPLWTPPKYACRFFFYEISRGTLSAPANSRSISPASPFAVTVKNQLKSTSDRKDGAHGENLRRKRTILL